jgi:arginine deiminase
MHGGHGTDTEVGRLRTVLVHRPGAELTRITPGTAAAFPFGRVPWLGRAQQEHDVFTGALRDQGADVLYLTELLQDVLEYPAARDQVIAAALDEDRGGQGRLGEDLRGQLRAELAGLDPETLSRVLITGLDRDEFRNGRGAVYQLLAPHDYLIEPLPALMFTRDASVWVGDRVLRVIGTGLTPPAAAAGPWDDAGNTLVTGPGRAVLFERHAATSVRLEAAGLEVTRVPGTELGSGRGGPRGLTCPVSRAPVGTSDPGIPIGAGV